VMNCKGLERDPFRSLSCQHLPQVIENVHEETQDIWHSEIFFHFNLFSRSKVKFLFLVELEYVKDHSAYRSHDSSVIIVAGYGLNDWGSVPGKGNILSAL
jgi:hypothetical protein